MLVAAVFLSASGAVLVALHSQVMSHLLQIFQQMLTAWLLQGLAFPAIANISVGPNPFFNAVQSNVLDAQQFSLYLNPDSSALDAGQLIFGGGDSSLYMGSLISYPVIAPT